MLGSVGSESIAVSGGVLSTLTGAIAESTALPTLSVARATSWYAPSAGCPDHATEKGLTAADPIETRFGAKLQSASGRQ